MSLSDDDDGKFLGDELPPRMTGGPASTHDSDDEMRDYVNYGWNDPDGATFNNFQGAAAASDAAADQAARYQATAADQAARYQATASAKAARDQATASAKAAQAIADAQALVQAMNTRNYYAYYGQPQGNRNVIDRYIAQPSNFPPFSGVEQTKQYTPEQRREADTAERAANMALEKALAAQRVAYRGGGYKSKSKFKNSRYNKKLKTIKRRRTRSRSRSRTRTRSRTNKRCQ
jgi:hypothetical protein